MEAITFKTMEADEMTMEDFVGVHEVMQDMWASESWLGELAQCPDCGKMVSKEEAFGYLPEKLAQDTVAKIMRVLGIETVPCTECQSPTHLVYGSENIEKIRERALWSLESYMVLCRSRTDEIVGFNEGYVAPLDRIFKLDLFDHYQHVGLPEIRSRVVKTLGYLPKEMLLMSAMGFLKPYRSFQNMFRLIHEYALKLPDCRAGMPGMVEYDRGGVTHRMNADVKRGISLGIEDDPVLRAKMTNVGEKYDCDLIVYPDVVAMHKDYFSKDIRHYLRMVKGKSI